MIDPPTIDIVMPARNEVATIRANVAAAQGCRYVRQVIVVDDGSVDGTAEAAAAAGVKLVRRDGSPGSKAHAMADGVAATDAEAIFFVDADCTGLTPDHLDEICEPFVAGTAVMSIGMFDYGPFWNPLVRRWPPLSGERVIPRWVFDAIPPRKLDGYTIETRINEVIAEGRLPTTVRTMRGVSHRTKRDKFGILEGIRGTWAMYRDLLGLLRGDVRWRTYWYYLQGLTVRSGLQDDTESGSSRRPEVLLGVLAITAAILTVSGPTAQPETAVGAEPDDPGSTFAPETTTTTQAGVHGLVDRSTVGQHWGIVPGLLMFRGNPTRTWYGLGPVPGEPGVVWRFPERRLCGDSTVGGVTREWCGTGWTGQPVVWERPDGITELIVGAYDHAIHFLDAATGSPTRPRFVTGDIIKGSVTLDPDGWPLLYAGSRDNRLRVIALDRPEPTELWALTPHPRGVWNTDWDGNPAIVDGMLIVGGEDSWLRVVDLHRALDDDGQVQVDPAVLVEVPGFDDELFSKVGDRNVSIESSVAVFEGTAYFANSGGRVLGVHLGRVRSGEAPIVFDFWMGDDVDATITIDSDGMLYVAAELERFLPRSRQVGQLVKLDPGRPHDPIVWSVAVPPRRAGEPGGLWATPALHRGVVYATTHPGELLAVDDATGAVLWREPIAYHSWSSPVVVDDTLIAATCDGRIRAFDVRDPRRPVARWVATTGTGGCFESTPAVWKGRIYIGNRDGFIYAFGDG